MIEQDTIKLLRECDAGIKMGISSLDDSMKYVKNSELKGILDNSAKEHIKIKHDMQNLLDRYHDDGKEPPVMAKGMEWIKTNVKLAVESSDNAVAAFITDGCNMGIKSLSRYMNQYKAADEKSKNISKKLISIEEKLAFDIRQFL
ncbi:MAG: hypothetical protein NC485_11640 [Ruminococcus flavefaciens]|nr:hypothetical protein [Ruminococcus flavefaciens]MCM1062537.1 hypothetical protein [Eubacterium sp.]